MAGRLRLAAVISLIAFVACSPVEPTMPTIGTSVNVSGQGRNVTFTVAPWPLDETVAFLCQRQPGSEFTIDDPRPAVDAGCVPLETATIDNTLQATFASDALDPDVVGELARSGPPWFLAAAGNRGPFSVATTFIVADLPIVDPPGPS